MSIYEIEIKEKSGESVSLGRYKGKVLLIVNTATGCGFTPQYDELQNMYEKYQDKGLEILDFPCNQFGGQAPGTDEEIGSFCTGRYGITFPQFAKIEVNGENAAPLYVWLKEQMGFQGFGKGIKAKAMDMMLKSMTKDKAYQDNPDIKWNFEKFLVDREGKVIARFAPTVNMAEVDRQIAALLANAVL